MYFGVKSLLIIADSGNNRIIVINEQNFTFLEQIGTGRSGHLDSDFYTAMFS